MYNLELLLLLSIILFKVIVGTYFDDVQNCLGAVNILY